MSEYLFKIVVIGDPGVGKTQMRYRFTQNVYNDNSKTTIGVDFATKLLVQNNGEMVKGMFSMKTFVPHPIMHFGFALDHRVLMSMCKTLTVRVQIIFEINLHS